MPATPTDDRYDDRQRGVGRRRAGSRHADGRAETTGSHARPSPEGFGIGPAADFGPGRAPGPAPDFGPGPGPGPGPDFGPAAGPGPDFGPGPGPGPDFGPGPGPGPDFGPGAGPGPGSGFGPGQGAGPDFGPQESTWPESGQGRRSGRRRRASERQVQQPFPPVEEPTAQQPRVPQQAPPSEPPPPGEVEPDADGEPAASAEEPLPVVKVRRLRSLAIAAFSLLATVALTFGAHTDREPDAVVVFGMQALFVVVWTIASRPPAPRVVIAVGLAVAIGTDVAAVVTKTASLEPMAYFTAAGFFVGVLGQLCRPAGRIRVTESLGSSLVVVVGVVSFATLIELARHPRGTEALTASLAAAGIAVAIARLADIVAPVPRIAPQVPRGGFGVVLGTMTGTAAAAIAGYYFDGLDTTRAALAGLVTALVAAMVDLSVGYAEAGRHVEGDAPALWIARHMQGPLGALAFTAPVAYAAGVLLLNVL